MNRLIPILCCFLLLCGCSGQPEPQPPEEPPLPPAAEEEAPADPHVFVPDRTLTPEETIEAYFDQVYTSYVGLEHIDISSILYLDEQSPRNLLTWLETLNQRRRLIADNGLAYVETARYDYTITYQPTSGDEREELWEDWVREEEGEVIYYFRITGEPGAVYPPLMAVNAVHNIRLKEQDGMWKITAHYFPGSVRKFYLADGLETPSDEDALKQLRREFAPDDPLEAPETDGAPYDGMAAAKYARLYAEESNPAFYRITDWVGNCANFTSQCVWAGFGGAEPDSGMTADWYGGEGGGSAAWENVDSFWEFITVGGLMSGAEFSSVSLAEAGDIVQICSNSAPDRGFTHSLIVVDADSLLLAQNSPACFVYYSDLVDVSTRWVRPTTLRAE